MSKPIILAFAGLFGFIECKDAASVDGPLTQNVFGTPTVSTLDQGSSSSDVSIKVKSCQRYLKGDKQPEDILPDYLRDGEIALYSNYDSLIIEVGPIDKDEIQTTGFTFRLGGCSSDWFRSSNGVFHFVKLPYGNCNLAVLENDKSGKATSKLLCIPIHVFRPFYFQIWVLVWAIVMAAFAAFILFWIWKVNFYKSSMGRPDSATALSPSQVGDNVGWSNPEWLLAAPEDTKQSTTQDIGLGDTALFGQKEMAWLQELETKCLANMGSHDFTIGYLSKLMLMSESKFYKTVHELTGHTPNQYIKEKRMMLAMNMIKEGRGRSKSLKMLANAVGMKDVKYFSQQFKERFGMHPSDIDKYSNSL